MPVNHSGKSLLAAGLHRLLITSLAIYFAFFVALVFISIPSNGASGIIVTLVTRTVSACQYHR
jgi:hypothetical protein